MKAVKDTSKVLEFLAKITFINLYLSTNSNCLNINKTMAVLWVFNIKLLKLNEIFILIRA